MAGRLTNARPACRGPVVLGIVGVLLFVAAGFSRLTNPAFSPVVSLVLGGSGLCGLWLYLRSDARDREQRMAASLSELASQRLRKQRSLSIALAIALIGLVGVPFGLSYFSEWIDPVLYNGVIGVCMIGMVFWSVAAALGHSARHSILDEHEWALAESDPADR